MTDRQDWPALTPRPRKRARDRLRKEPTARLPGFVPPQLPTLSAKAPAGDGWLHEIKWDGYRLQLRWDGTALTVYSRNGHDWSERFPTVAAAFRALRLPACVLDCEVTVLDERGRSDHVEFKRDMGKGDDRAMVFQIFDALHIAGRDLMKLPQLERKAKLAALLDKAHPQGALQFVEHHRGDGPALFARACEMGLEGLVSKRADAPYSSGPSKRWLKVKCIRRQEFVILGWQPSVNGSAWVGSVAVGYYDAKRRLTYAGHVGTGFTDAESERLARRLKPLELGTRPAAPVQNLARANAKGLRYVRPELVAEIEYRAWSGDRLMRGASYKGLREDKPARDVRLEAER